MSLPSIPDPQVLAQPDFFFNDSVPNVNEKFDSRIKVKKTIVKGEPIREPSVKAAVQYRQNVGQNFIIIFEL